MTDHEARARDEISGPSTNVFADLDLPHHAKATEIVNAAIDRGVLISSNTYANEKYLISAISQALWEAEEAKEATIAEQAERIVEQADRIAELEARLEIDHAYQWQGDSEELVRIDIAPEDRATFPDGITSRDATIKLQDEALERKRERISSLEATVAKAFLRCQALEEAVKPFAIQGVEIESADDIYVYYRNTNGEGIILPSVQISDFSRARSVLCHADPVPGCETSSAEGPPHSTDGEARCDCHLHETQVCDICQGIAVETPQEPPQAG